MGIRGERDFPTARLTTPAEVSGQRFLRRRAELALLTHDADSRRDPIRTHRQALAIGLALAGAGAAIAIVASFIKPAERLADNRIVVSRESGAMYVVLPNDDHRTLHPVLNLASARLIVGQPADPVLLSDAELRQHSRGALLGIPGAPPTIGGSPPSRASWHVCDERPADQGPNIRTTVIVHSDERLAIRALASDEAILVVNSDRAYLVHGGRRAEIDLADSSVRNALRLDGVRPRIVSKSLLNSIEPAASIAAPAIAGVGALPSFNSLGYRVGAVVRTQRESADSARYFVVLADGLQPVGELTADLIRFRDSQAMAYVPTVPPDFVSAAPVSHGLATATLPERAPRIGGDDRAVMCSGWRLDSGGLVHRAVSVAAVMPLADGERVVGLAQADAAGDGVDGAFVAPGRGFFARADRGGALFWVSDTGVKFGIADDEAAKNLGMTQTPLRVPAYGLELLATGPTLGAAQALIAHDSLPADDSAKALAPPRN